MLLLLVSCDKFPKNGNNEGGNPKHIEYYKDRSDFEEKLMSLVKSEKIYTSFSYKGNLIKKDYQVSITFLNPREDLSKNNYVKSKCDRIVKLAKNSIKNLRNFNSININFKTSKVVDDVERLSSVIINKKINN